MARRLDRRPAPISWPSSGSGLSSLVLPRSASSTCRAPAAAYLRGDGVPAAVGQWQAHGDFLLRALDDLRRSVLRRMVVLVDTMQLQHPGAGRVARAARGAKVAVTPMTSWGPDAAPTCASCRQRPGVAASGYPRSCACHLSSDRLNVQTIWPLKIVADLQVEGRS